MDGYKIQCKEFKLWVQRNGDHNNIKSEYNKIVS